MELAVEGLCEEAEGGLFRGVLPPFGIDDGSEELVRFTLFTGFEPEFEFA